MQKTRAKSSPKKPPLPMPDALLDATPHADVVRIPPRVVVAFDGVGPPEAPAFEQGIGAVYGVAYTIKFARKAAGHDFRIGPLEARWWAEPPPPPGQMPPRASWRWQVRLAVPNAISEADVAEAAAKKTIAGVQRVFLDAQTVGRILHIGPYADEPRSLEAARAALADAGLGVAGPHVEIYLNDPRRVAAEKLRTVLLVEPGAR